MNNLMIKYLIEDDSMTEEEAEDFIGYNTLRATDYMSGNRPIVVYFAED